MKQSAKTPPHPPYKAPEERTANLLTQSALVPTVIQFGLEFREPVLRIRDVYPRSRLIFIPDPNFSIPDPGSASKNFSILTQKIIFKL
jgi:hypothetical protein